MRQLKAFMKAKKGVCSKKCECLTINMWRCADLQNGYEFCGCGESKSSLPNYFMVEGNATTGGLIQFFNNYYEDEQGNSISIEIDTDTEVGGYRIVVGEFGIIGDEDARALWYGVWENLDGEAVLKLFGMDEGRTGVGRFTPEAMAQFNAFVNNPTEEQAQILKDWLEYKASDEQHSPIVIFDPKKSVGDKVYVELIDTQNNESKMKIFTTGASGEDYIYSNNDERALVGTFDSEWGEALVDMLENDSSIMLFMMGKGGNMPTTGQVGTIDADAMVLVRKVFEDPSEENKQELTNFLQAHIEAVQGGDTNAFLVTYPASGSSIVVGDKQDISVENSGVAQFLVSPNNESITVVSNNPELLRIDSVEKASGTPLNVRVVNYTGLNVGTTTITVTCVNDPSVSATTPTITINPGR